MDSAASVVARRTQWSPEQGVTHRPAPAYATRRAPDGASRQHADSWRRVSSSLFGSRHRSCSPGELAHSHSPDRPKNVSSRRARRGRDHPQAALQPGGTGALGGVDSHGGQGLSLAISPGTGPRTSQRPHVRALRLIGAPGFEPGTSATQRPRATRLRHAPNQAESSPPPIATTTSVAAIWSAPRTGRVASAPRWPQLSPSSRSATTSNGSAGSRTLSPHPMT